MVEPLLGIGAIPFDYKFYSFRGQVGLIIQIDRNSGPVKIAMFDGEFRPLKRGADFLLSSRARQGVPLIPLHAPEMLWWAQRLSLEADAPFVSIDMFDSPTGPVFGEFTYSPGGTHKRMFTFSHALLDRFDRLITEPGSTRRTRAVRAGDAAVCCRSGAPAFQSLGRLCLQRRIQRRGQTAHVLQAAGGGLCTGRPVGRVVSTAQHPLGQGAGQASQCQARRREAGASGHRRPVRRSRLAAVELADT